MSVALCGEIMTPKVKYQEELLNPLGTSHVQLHTGLVFIDLALDNTVTTQNFKYEMSNILDKLLYICCNFCLPGRSRTTLVARVRWHRERTETMVHCSLLWVSLKAVTWCWRGRLPQNYLAEDCVYGR